MTETAPTRRRIPRLFPMLGRDPGEPGRTVTPLELLFDLAFVAAIGVAADEFAHLVAFGHAFEGVVGFVFAMFAICWAWMAFSWFASAFDTDDWFYRVATMVQMTGVIVLAVGLPTFFHSLEDGLPPDNTVMVAGYVVMRVAIVAQWLRVARQDPAHRATAIGMAISVLAVQLCWVVVAIVALPLGPFLAISVVLAAVELAAPRVIERRAGRTPWHAHHLAERYGLFAIIVLGEGVFGTIAAVNALVDVRGWSADAITVLVAGTALTFSMWWIYFIMPSGAVLHRFRDRVVLWGYGHMVIYAAIAAVGAGLHVAAYVIEGESTLGTVLTVVAVALPVLIFAAGLFGLYTRLVGEGDPFHGALFAGTVVMLVAAVVLAAVGVGLAVCLVVVTLAPVVIVVGYERVGHAHRADMLERIAADH